MTRSRSIVHSRQIPACAGMTGEGRVPLRLARKREFSGFTVRHSRVVTVAGNWGCLDLKKLWRSSMDVAASMAVVCLGGRRFRFGEPSDIVAQLSELMAEEEKQTRYVS